MMGFARPYKPQMHSLSSFSEIPLGPDSIITAKLDGEFNVLRHEVSSTWTVNLWETTRHDLPCIVEARDTLNMRRVRSAKMLAELFGVGDDGRMLRLPKFIHEIRSGDRKKVHLGIHDLIEVEGEHVIESYLWRLQEVKGWFEGCQRVGPVPFKEVKTREEVAELWETWVVAGGYEGLVAHSGNSVYKVKPKDSLDAVIIGLNKKGLWEQEQATSFKIALMDGKRLVEVGDVASGIDVALRTTLFKLTKYAVQNTEETVYIQPFVVVEVEYTETFESLKPVYAWERGRLERVGELPFCSLRHPRLVRFRTDKKAVEADVSTDQLGGIMSTAKGIGWTTEKKEEFKRLHTSRRLQEGEE